MKRKAKEKVALNKEEIAESYCFVCKDGGDLRICDNKKCLKCFHPGCVGKEDSFLECDNHWACAWHTCDLCPRSSYIHCYTCTSAVCRHCLHVADFFQIKGKYGFCKFCLDVALLIEENKDHDSDGEKVDFTDMETYEGLFKDYYYIIKKHEGFESGDLYAAKWVKTKKDHQSASGLEEYEEEEDETSDSDSSEDEKSCKKKRKGKRSEREKSAIRTPTKSNKIEFIGWASRSLIEFLRSIGKGADESLSQHDVTSIINEYVKEHKLLNPKKRKMIMCDARLKSLFRRRTINRYKLNDLLEAHFAENYDESDEDEVEYDSEDENESILNVCKRQKKVELEDKVHQNCYASIIVENIKLVYLKKSLLLELLNQPGTFEEKVVGSFIRVKCDLYDYCSRNTHQLMQVEGVKKILTGEINMEAVLLSSMPKEISVNLLSDDDLSEEECEDLRQKMLAGQLKRPTVWINKELALLPKLIERANEKGWRRELFEYLEKKKKLQSPLEQAKLLENIPRVIPDVLELNLNAVNIIKEMERGNCSPGSNVQCNPSVQDDGCEDSKASEEKRTRRNHVRAAAEQKQFVSVPIEPQHSKQLEHDHASPGKNDLAVDETAETRFRAEKRRAWDLKDGCAFEVQRVSWTSARCHF